MKRILAFTLTMLVAGAVALAQEGPGHSKEKKTAPVTLTGEVLDMYCYMDRGAMGPDHMKCAQSCIKKGLPVGFLAADGTVYLVTGKEHEPVNATLAEWAGKKSSITGIVKENHGVKAIEFVSIAEAMAAGTK